MCWKVVFLCWIPVEIVYIHRLNFSSSFEHNLKNMWQIASVSYGKTGAHDLCLNLELVCFLMSE